MSPAPPSTTSGPAKAPSTPDPVMLSIFSNRFMSVAEAMGKTLQQTAISTNIKERLDYSCALFSPTAQLVANAPFVPVHLGSMSFTVQWQLNLHGDSLRPGDVLMTNHPTAGNSHLPDITLITPVFEGDKIIFFVASRGHHADIGGILAGSMPPTSTELYQEGAMCRSFFIVKGGTFNREELYRIMVEEPAQYEGCSGCRSFSDVESDLKAQIAANHKGAQLIGKLIKEYGLPTVHAYMDFIRDNAELAIRELLKRTAATYGTKLSALDHMDDGSPIALEITIDPADGSAVFDFEGTGPEVRGCWNAPEAVVHAAIIYCLRALCAVDMPLNGGCLAPIDVRIPQNSFLSPSDTAAVCGGNVVTSQRVTDVVLKAFNACADSQGCCNNLTFGAGGKDEHGNVKAGWGYYETICGGSGAGPTWEGTSAVQVHMTNTRITDVELAERRYPVIIHQFAIRRDGGGQGKFNGGNGVVREFEFTEPLQVSILSERRVHRPSGMHGGLPGAAGVNHWVKKGARLEDGSEAPAKTVNIGGKASVMMAAGDRLLLKTPGGGGWGAPSERAADEASKQAFVNNWAPRGSLADHAAKQEGQ